MTLANPGTSGTGAAGLSAYALAVQQGFSGTLNQWLASLVGAQGDDGDQGPQGVPGGGVSSIWPGGAMALGTRPAYYALTGLTNGGDKLNVRWRVRFPKGAGLVRTAWRNAHCPGTARVTGLPGGHYSQGGFDDPGPNHVRIRLSVETQAGKVIPFWAPLGSNAPDQEASPDGRYRTLLVPPGGIGYWEVTPLDLPPGSSSTDDVFVRMYVEPADATGAYSPTGQIPQQNWTLGTRRPGETVWIGPNETDRSLATGALTGASGSIGNDLVTGAPIPLQFWAVDPPSYDTSVSPYNRGVIVSIGDSELGDAGYGYFALALADRYAFTCTGRQGDTAADFAVCDDRTEYRRRMIQGCTHAYVQYLTNDLGQPSSLPIFLGFSNAVCAILRRYGVKTIVWATLTPITRSPDGWTTLANQRLDVVGESRYQHNLNEPTRQAWNAHLRSGTPVSGAAGWYVAPPDTGADFVCDSSGPLEILEFSSADNAIIGKWINQSGVATTLDGLHPSPAGDLLRVPVVQNNLGVFNL